MNSCPLVVILASLLTPPNHGYSLNLSSLILQNHYLLTQVLTSRLMVADISVVLLDQKNPPIITSVILSLSVLTNLIDWLPLPRPHPHAAYAVITHGFLSKFTYLFRTTPDVSKFVESLENIFRCKLIPTLSDQSGVNDLFRSIPSLPARLGGLRIIHPLSESSQQYHDSIFILSPLTNAIIDTYSTQYFHLLHYFWNLLK